MEEGGQRSLTRPREKYNNLGKIVGFYAEWALRSLGLTGGRL